MSKTHRLLLKLSEARKKYEQAKKDAILGCIRSPIAFRENKDWKLEIKIQKECEAEICRLVKELKKQENQNEKRNGRRGYEQGGEADW